MRITARGLALAFVAAGCYALGRAIGVTELLMMATACAVVFLIALLAMVIQRGNVRVVRSIEPSFVSVGEEAIVTLSAVNLSNRSSGDLILVEQAGDVSRSLPLESIPGGVAAETRYRCHPQRRGRMRIGPALIRRSDIFGLMRRDRQDPRIDELLVLPRVHRIAPPYRVASRASSQDRSARVSSSGDAEFHALRDYVEGDDLRHVHWASSARFGTLVVRQHEYFEPTAVTLLLDQRPTSDENDAEFGVETCASIASAALDDSQRLIIIGTATPARRFTGDERLPMLSHLADVPVQVQGSLRRALRECRASAGGGILVIVTPNVSEETLVDIAELSVGFPRVHVVAIGGQDARDVVRNTLSRRGGESSMSVVVANSADSLSVSWNALATLGDLSADAMAKASI